MLSSTNVSLVFFCSRRLDWPNAQRQRVLRSTIRRPKREHHRPQIQRIHSVQRDVWQNSTIFGKTEGKTTWKRAVIRRYTSRYFTGVQRLQETGGVRVARLENQLGGRGQSAAEATRVRRVDRQERWPVAQQRVQFVHSTEDHWPRRAPRPVGVHRRLDCHPSTTTPQCRLADLIFNCAFSISFQVALLHVLEKLKILPDYIVSESFGELAAAYADGVLSADEAVLSAYAIGTALSEAKIVPTQSGKRCTCISAAGPIVILFYFFFKPTCKLCFCFLFVHRIVRPRRFQSFQTVATCFTIRK